MSRQAANINDALTNSSSNLYGPGDKLNVDDPLGLEHPSNTVSVRQYDLPSRLESGIVPLHLQAYAGHSFPVCSGWAARQMSSRHRRIGQYGEMEIIASPENGEIR